MQPLVHDFPASVASIIQGNHFLSLLLSTEQSPLLVEETVVRRTTYSPKRNIHLVGLDEDPHFLILFFLLERDCLLFVR